MTVRAIRGATCLHADDATEMFEAVAELMGQMLERNSIDSEDVISLFLTSTPDLVCAFPAAGVRAFGLSDVPLLCAQEIDVAGALPRVVRIMAHVSSDLPKSDINHVYLRGAEVLRADLIP
jgi:chorismate mutase